mmetsp:Transcript_137879/g.195105  ORF Transcript_137879/g.195105 Transcript_137879/m.195105 type:complete len:223 (+) Transcript_137879:971-1639(+)
MIAKNSTVQDNLVTLNSSVGTILGDVGTMQTAFNDASTFSRTIADSIISVIDSLASTKETADTRSSTINSVLTAFFAPTLAMGCLIIIFMIVIKLFKFKKLNYFLYVAWFLLAFINWFTWLATFLLYPISVVATEICGIQSDFFSSGSFFNKTMDTFNVGTGTFNEFTYFCVHGSSGDVVQYLNIGDQTGTFNNIYNSLTSTQDYWTDGSRTLVNSVVIPFQ